MKDKHRIGSCRGYIMNQSSNLISVTISSLLEGSSSNEKVNLNLIQEMLDDFYISSDYNSRDDRLGAYHTFKIENFPKAVLLINKAVAKSLLTRDKWMPLLEDFFAKANAYILDKEKEFAKK